MALKKGPPYRAVRSQARLPPVEPGAQAAQAMVDETGPAAPPEAGTAATAPGVQPAAANGAGQPPAARPEREAVVVIRFAVPYPAKGVSAEFDMIAEHYDPGTAARTVFRRAFAEFVALIDAGENPGTSVDYPEGPGRFVSTRNIPKATFDRAAKLLDPLGIRSKTYLGELIALTAFARYLNKG